MDGSELASQHDRGVRMLALRHSAEELVSDVDMLPPGDGDVERHSLAVAECCGSPWRGLNLNMSSTERSGTHTGWWSTRFRPANRCEDPSSRPHRRPIVEPPRWATAEPAASGSD